MFRINGPRRVSAGTGQRFYKASVYVRDTQKVLTQVMTEPGAGVAQTGPENLGARHDAGLAAIDP